MIAYMSLTTQSTHVAAPGRICRRDVQLMRLSVDLHSRLLHRVVYVITNLLIVCCTAPRPAHAPTPSYDCRLFLPVTFSTSLLYAFRVSTRSVAHGKFRCCRWPGRTVWITVRKPNYNVVRSSYQQDDLTQRPSIYCNVQWQCRVLVSKLCLQPFVTLLTAHVSENFSKHTSLIHYLSFLLPYVFM